MLTNKAKVSFLLSIAWHPWNGPRSTRRQALHNPLRPQDEKRAIAVADAIGMTSLGARFVGSHLRRVALLSPDQKKFVVVLHRGNLEQIQTSILC